MPPWYRRFLQSADSMGEYTYRRSIHSSPKSDHSPFYLSICNTVQSTAVGSSEMGLLLKRDSLDTFFSSWEVLFPLGSVRPVIFCPSIQFFEPSECWRASLSFHPTLCWWHITERVLLTTNSREDADVGGWGWGGYGNKTEISRCICCPRTQPTSSRTTCAGYYCTLGSLLSGRTLLGKKTIQDTLYHIGSFREAREKNKLIITIYSDIFHPFIHIYTVPSALTSLSLYALEIRKKNHCWPDIH